MDPRLAQGPRLADRPQAVVALALRWSNRPAVAATRAQLRETAVAEREQAVAVLGRRQPLRVAPLQRRNIRMTCSTRSSFDRWGLRKTR
jgi:hypothetical protein